MFPSAIFVHCTYSNAQDMQCAATTTGMLACILNHTGMFMRKCCLCPVPCWWWGYYKYHIQTHTHHYLLTKSLELMVRAGVCSWLHLWDGAEPVLSLSYSLFCTSSVVKPPCIDLSLSGFGSSLFLFAFASLKARPKLPPPPHGLSFWCCPLKPQHCSVDSTK